MPGQPGIRDFLQQRADDFIPQRTHMLDARHALLRRQPQRFGEPDNVRHVLRPGAQAEFLSAAGLGRKHGRPFAHVQSADALRPVEFVPAERHQIHAERLHIDWQVRGGLDGVGVKQDAVPVTDFGDFADGVDCANLVVGVHDRDQRRFVAKGLFHGGGRDHAGFIHVQPFDLETELFFQLLRGFADGGMLGARSQNPGGAGFFALGQRHAAQGQVVGFRAAGGENHLVRAAIQNPGDGFAGGIQRGFGLLPIAVDGGRVAEGSAKVGQHGVQDAGVDGGGGGVIQINHFRFPIGNW